MKKNFLIFIMSFNIYFELNLLNLCHGFKDFFFETHNVNFSLYLFSLSRFFFSTPRLSVGLLSLLCATKRDLHING